VEEDSVSNRFHPKQAAASIHKIFQSTGAD